MGSFRLSINQIFILGMLLPFFTFVEAVQSQSSIGTVRIWARDANAKPIPFAKIGVAPTTTDGIWNPLVFTANESGYLDIDDLSPGFYYTAITPSPNPEESSPNGFVYSLAVPFFFNEGMLDNQGVQHVGITADIEVNHLLKVKLREGLQPWKGALEESSGAPVVGTYVRYVSTTGNVNPHQIFIPTDSEGNALLPIHDGESADSIVLLLDRTKTHMGVANEYFLEQTSGVEEVVLQTLPAPVRVAFSFVDENGNPKAVPDEEGYELLACQRADGPHSGATIMTPDNLTEEMVVAYGETSCTVAVANHVSSTARLNVAEGTTAVNTTIKMVTKNAPTSVSVALLNRDGSTAPFDKGSLLYRLWPVPDPTGEGAELVDFNSRISTSDQETFNLAPNTEYFLTVDPVQVDENNKFSAYTKEYVKKDQIKFTTGPNGGLTTQIESQVIHLDSEVIVTSKDIEEDYLVELSYENPDDPLIKKKAFGGFNSNPIRVVGGYSYTVKIVPVPKDLLGAEETVTFISSKKVVVTPPINSPSPTYVEVELPKADKTLIIEPQFLDDSGEEVATSEIEQLGCYIKTDDGSDAGSFNPNGATELNIPLSTGGERRAYELNCQGYDYHPSGLHIGRTFFGLAAFVVGPNESVVKLKVGLSSIANYYPPVEKIILLNQNDQAELPNGETIAHFPLGTVAGVSSGTGVLTVGSSTRHSITSSERPYGDVWDMSFRIEGQEVTDLAKEVTLVTPVDPVEFEKEYGFPPSATTFQAAYWNGSSWVKDGEASYNEETGELSLSIKRMGDAWGTLINISEGLQSLKTKIKRARVLTPKNQKSNTRKVKICFLPRHGLYTMQLRSISKNARNRQNNWKKARTLRFSTDTEGEEKFCKVVKAKKKNGRRTKYQYRLRPFIPDTDAESESEGVWSAVKSFLLK